MKAKPKPFHLDGRKIAVIALVIVVAGYQWYVNRSAELELDSEPTTAEVSSDKYEINFPAGETESDDGARGHSGSQKTAASGKSSGEKPSGENPSDLRFNPLKPTAGNSIKGNAEVEGAYLLPAGGKNLKSPGGLMYLMSRNGEHRAEHVLRHATDQPNRSGPHGVFDVQGDDVFRLIDEAYALVKQKSKQVQTKTDDGKTVLVIDMKRKIGYRGGQQGKRDGHPPLSKIKLILGDNRVISAYPY